MPVTVRECPAFAVSLDLYGPTQVELDAVVGPLQRIYPHRAEAANGVGGLPEHAVVSGRP
ncbi:MAG: hypothetical protein LBV60_11660 [Streptomyces sp.]|jgi:hypothetical protein|nr:hypothetical protein [Streptomyces sp.]